MRERYEREKVEKVREGRSASIEEMIEIKKQQKRTLLTGAPSMSRSPSPVGSAAMACFREREGERERMREEVAEEGGRVRTRKGR